MNAPRWFEGISLLFKLARRPCLQPHYCWGPLSGSHICRSLFVVFICINWSLLWKMLMINDARRNWSRAYLHEFSAFWLLLLSLAKVFTQHSDDQHPVDVRRRFFPANFSHDKATAHTAFKLNFSWRIFGESIISNQAHSQRWSNQWHASLKQAWGSHAI